MNGPNLGGSYNAAGTELWPEEAQGRTLPMKGK